MTSYKTYTVDQYAAFLSQPFSNNFGMSEEQVANWFMSQPGSIPVRSKYGVTKENLLSTYIPRLKEAFNGGYFIFLAVTVTEGGGAGNWVNHFVADTSVGGLNCMNDDIEYINGLDKSKGPAMDAIEVAGPYIEDVPGKTEEVYQKVPNQSIGAYFMPSTMAGNSWVFGEKWSLAHQGPRPPAVYYGNPYDQIIDVIKSAGADPFNNIDGGNDGGNNDGGNGKPKPTCAQSERIQIFDAETDKLLKEVFVEPSETRDDLKDKHTDLKGVENSGFDVCIDFEYTKPFYVKFHRVMEDCSEGDLNFQTVFFPHSYSRADKGTDYCAIDCNSFITIGSGKKKKYYTGGLLGSVGWTFQANYVASCTIKVPSTEAFRFGWHDDVQIVINGKLFDGIVTDIKYYEDNHTADVTIEHKISEWEYRQIPSGYTVSDMEPYELMKQSPFVYSKDWYIDNNGNERHEKMGELYKYKFPKMSHLDALNKAVELTRFNWWRVGTRYERYLEIGEFGEKKNYVVSTHGNSKYHIPILSYVTVIESAANVYNVATVFNEKSDDSVDGLTLKWAYLEQQKLGHPIEEGFPIVILDPVRKEKETWKDISNIAADTTLEFAVLDENSIIEENGKLIEKTISIKDISQYVAYNDDDIVDDDTQRGKSINAYRRVVRSMSQKGSRINVMQLKVGKLPCDLNVMDRIFLDYDNQTINSSDDCNDKCDWAVRRFGWYYITQISTSFDQNFVETNNLTLSLKAYKDGDFYRNEQA